MKKFFLFFLFVGAAFLTKVPTTQAGCTYTVTTTVDSGVGSLRQAILDANGNPGDDTICFNIPGAGVHTIQPTSPLPDITESVEINGYSQPGSSPNTLADGIDAVLNIELDGTNAGICCTTVGLALSANNNRIRGLVINRFSGNGIYLTGADNNVVEGNFIGTDPSGTLFLPVLGGAGVGIVLGSDNNLIGGTTPASRNLISGNPTDVQIPGGTGNLIQGNFIGTDVTGLSGIGNTNGGGIVIFDSGNQVGGTDPGSGNVIAFNKFSGVAIVDTDPMEQIRNNAILGNSIFSNTNLGINLAVQGETDPAITFNDPLDADDGSNLLQNFPELTSALSDSGTLTIQGGLASAPNTTFRIEYFSNDACDDSEYGEGQRFLGFQSVTTDGSGNADVSTDLPAASGLFLTATATDPDGNTSEFSKCVTIEFSEVCDDGVDNDGDGQTDCSDADCSTDADCADSGTGGCGLGISDAMPPRGVSWAFLSIGLGFAFLMWRKGRVVR